MRRQLIAFRPLLGLQTTFPVTDKTTFNSIRIDHQITKDQHLTFALDITPARLTGISGSNRRTSHSAKTIFSPHRHPDTEGLFHLWGRWLPHFSSRMVNELRF